jgi:hypothetical protein
MPRLAHHGRQAHPESLVTLGWRTNENEIGLDRHDESFLEPKEGFGGGVFSIPNEKL